MEPLTYDRASYRVYAGNNGAVKGKATIGISRVLHTFKLTQRNCQITAADRRKIGAAMALLEWLDPLEADPQHEDPLDQPDEDPQHEDALDQPDEDQ